MVSLLFTVIKESIFDLRLREETPQSCVVSSLNQKVWVDVTPLAVVSVCSVRMF